MRSIDAPLREAIVKEQEAQGRHGPHNFVESAEATVAGLNVENPQTARIVEGLDEVIAEGYPEVRSELEES